MKVNVMIARFPYGGTEATQTVDWLLEAEHFLSRHPNVDGILRFKIDDTPITMGRNRAFKTAKEHGVDLLLMVDSDMHPDCEVGEDPTAVPFLEAALPFVLDHHGPCAVAAPYCGPPPVENVYVFRWRNLQNDDANANQRIQQYTREEAAAMGGIHEAAALPTGLYLIDMRAYDRLVAAKLASLKGRPPGARPDPVCFYEWTDWLGTEKASTEDVTLSRDLSLVGVPQYCAWDSWAGHVKKKVVRKPRLVTPNMAAESIRAGVIARNAEVGERLVDVKSRPRPQVAPPPQERLDRIARNAELLRPNVAPVVSQSGLIMTGTTAPPTLQQAVAPVTDGLARMQAAEMAAEAKAITDALKGRRAAPPPAGENWVAAAGLEPTGTPFGFSPRGLHDQATDVIQGAG